jgi:hypothetical protein
LKRFPTLQSDIAAAANDSLERFREDGRKTVLRLVEMEASYLTVEFFRKLPTEPEKAADKNTPVSDRYQDNHLRRIGKFIFHSLFVNLSKKDTWLSKNPQPLNFLLSQEHMINLEEVLYRLNWFSQ